MKKEQFNTKEITREIIETLKTFSEWERIDKMKRYAPTSMKTLGVSNPNVKMVVSLLAKQLKASKDEEIISVSIALVESNVFECQIAAWWLLEKRKGLIQGLTRKQMASLRGTLDNWVSVDSFGVIIYGAMWKAGTVSNEDILQLADSQNFWYRRLALVSTVHLNLKSRGGEGDSARTIQVCEALAGDQEQMVQKALSWALRSLIRWDHQSVESFLDHYWDVVSNRVRREVNHKLQHGTKN